ncbi:GNAT family N-acetyltransferase [Micromonospora sp. NPDC000089]|uniref:GNAT family N-acetyltransferase n=1 Tax=Micromonospora sp. NPDC000089 TaxID=3364213 RepID=UPI0036BD1431
MTDIRIIEVHDDATAEDWRNAHNEIIPADPLSPEEVRERRGRHHLEVAYRDAQLIGCTTIRPPTTDTRTATVIVRVLPADRRQGIGGLLHERALERARAFGADRIETIVWAGNPTGSAALTDDERERLDTRIRCSASMSTAVAKPPRPPADGKHIVRVPRQRLIGSSIQQRYDPTGSVHESVAPSPDWSDRAGHRRGHHAWHRIGSHRPAHLRLHRPGHDRHAEHGRSAQ